MIEIVDGTATRTFTVERHGVTEDAPFHEPNADAFRRELQQRGLRPDGDVTVASIDEQEPDRHGQPHTVITYQVDLQSEEGQG
ncbi:hypothetical protein [Lentzea flava]|uniref:Uncharacterized protein n=1 Tax=Lentzea flava TaxID=103732 RepID=A0ABQ2V007_9PSEU|nr:hypothetical protein [Lentzea flava]MCP2202717.1 hypothetical protein [Lentzea flava]GGU61698.1 hypothetical protein GCM10010178_62340 [Lentzea flava]